MSREQTTTPRRKSKAVRLDLSQADHVRLERCATARGLNKSGYSRQAVLEKIKADERAVES